MERAIWATWYDLPIEGRDEYLAWLHEEYLPGLLASRGICWAAHYASEGASEAMDTLRGIFPKTEDTGDMGTGTQFVLIVGAPEVWTFLGPGVVAEQAALTGTARRMLDMRLGVRPCILSVFAHVNGPEIHRRPPGTTPGPAIQMGSFRALDLETEFDVGAWYAQYRLPAMARMPGCIAARVMVSVAGWAKYSVLYEFTSLEARMENFEKPHEALALDEQEWTGRVVRKLNHSPGSPTVGRRIWPLVTA